jgi:AcrR family transcriptional regulator
VSDHATREKILHAALACFLERGFDATSIADIRTACGVSTGSIYHFFGNKAGIAIAVWDEAIAGWRALSQGAGVTGSAQDQIRGSVGGLLLWARDNPDHFRVYDEVLRLSTYREDLAPIREKMSVGHAVAASLYMTWANDGAVKDVPWPLARAAMLGPSLEFLRSEGVVDADTIAFLIQIAWEAVCVDRS